MHYLVTVIINAPLTVQSIRLPNQTVEWKELFHNERVTVTIQLWVNQGTGKKW